ncbi:MAG: NAD(P)/FAD-dependent oxidoreductase [Georgfuchsia sp.]
MNTNHQTTTTDIVIVGAGPSGLFAAFECGMLGLKVHIVEALAQPGGQCSALYPEKTIFDIPAIPNITAGQLISQLLEQVAPFTPAFHCASHIRSLDRLNERWRVALDSGTLIDCGAVIVATGAGMLRPNRPDWPGLEHFEGKGVHYGVVNKEAFCGRRIVIAGGGDSAADWAVELASVAQSVHLIHRRARFRAAPETLRKVNRLVDAGQIHLLAPAHVTSLGGNGPQLSCLEIDCDGARRWIDCDDLLLFFGLSTDNSPCRGWGLEMEDGQIRINAKTCATNLPGVFAIGDAAGFPGKLKLILAGFSEAATAAHQAYRHCRPDDELFIEHSTARGVPTVS